MKLGKKGKKEKQESNEKTKVEKLDTADVLTVGSGSIPDKYVTRSLVNVNKSDMLYDIKTLERDCLKKFDQLEQQISARRLDIKNSLDIGDYDSAKLYALSIIEKRAILKQYVQILLQIVAVRYRSEVIECTKEFYDASRSIPDIYHNAKRSLQQDNDTLSVVAKIIEESHGLYAAIQLIQYTPSSLTAEKEIEVKQLIAEAGEYKEMHFDDILNDLAKSKYGH